MMILVEAAALDTLPNVDRERAGRKRADDRTRLKYPPLAIAIVAPDPRTFEDASQSRAHQGGSGSNRRVFRSREAALTWLDEQRRSAG